MSRQRDPGRVGLVLLLLGAIGLILTSNGRSAALAEEDTAQPSAALTVSALTGILGPGSTPPPDDPGEEPTYEEDLSLRVLVENDGQLPLTAARLVIEVHPPALTRGLLAEALDGELDGPALHVHTQPLQATGALAPGDIAGLEDRMLREEVAWAPDAGGVHPVRLAVTLGTQVLDEVITAVVWLNETPSTPLVTSMIWPVDTAPWRAPGGNYPDGLEQQTRPGARLDRLIGALERGPASVPVVMAPAAHLLEDLSDRSDGYTTLVRTEAGRLESRSVSASSSGAVDASSLLRRIREVAADLVLAPISGAYADADLTALLAGDDTLAELAAIAATDGRRRVQLQLGTEVDGATHLVLDPIDEETLDVLPGESLVLPAPVTDTPRIGGDPELGSPVRSLRAPSGRLLTGVIADPYLDVALRELEQDTTGMVATQRVVAETAMAYLTAPSQQQRGLVLLPPRTWDPPGAVAEDLLRNLADASWLRFVAPNQLATEVERGSGVLGLAPSEQGPFLPSFAADLTSAWDGLEAAIGAAPAGTTRLADRPVDELRDDLLRATSRWFRGPREGDAAALIRDVQRAVDRTFGDVSVATSSVTLTSDTGEVPVTVQRDRGGPLLVTVSVESQGRLLWPEGRTSEIIELDEDGATTVSFSTQAVSTGTFPVTVIISDPSGIHELARDTLSVRSTAISGPALTGLAALVVILLLAGALRRPERPRLAVVRDTGADRG